MQSPNAELMLKSILVLESTWQSNSLKPLSVWPFLNEFANAIGIESYYQRFTNTQSFEHWINIFNEKNANISKPKLLYIAAHGGVKQIYALENKINGDTIFDIIKKAKNIEYVHFGSCKFGNIDNLSELLKKAKHIKMAAGYKEELDWVDSTAFDLMLWQRISTRDEDNKGRKSHTVVDNFINKEVNGLSKKLGFRCCYRYGNAIKRIESE